MICHGYTKSNKKSDYDLIGQWNLFELDSFADQYKHLRQTFVCKDVFIFLTILFSTSSSSIAASSSLVRDPEGLLASSVAIFDSVGYKYT